MGPTRRNLLAALHFIGAICLSFHVQAQEGKGLTWAILGDERAVETSIADMLTVKLDASGFQLVARSQLEELELELQRSLESGSLEASMKIGRRIAARRLIICQVQPDSTEPNNIPFSLRVFVCDCDAVARIAIADFELSNPVAVVDNVSEWLRSVANADRIERVVGLAPIACKNLGDEYSDIGKRTYDFLSAQILAIPGVALIEWEETRALNREIDVTDAAGRRIVPSFISVDYRVLPSSEETPTLVEVAISLQSARQPIKESATLPLLDLESWLCSKILPHLLAAGAQGNSMSRAEQIQFLKKRVQTLFRLGAVQSSAQVREVILQIDPKDSAERLRLISDYGQLTKISDRKRLATLYPLGPVEIQARSFQREHFEYLVRNNQISYAEAIDRFPAMIIDPDSRWVLNRISPKFALSQVDLVRTLGSLEQDLEFVRAVGPAILKLNRRSTRADDVELKRRVAWSQAVLSVARLSIWFNFGSEESRIEVIRLINDIIPADFPTIELGEWLFDTRTFPRQYVIVSNQGTSTVERFEAGMWAEDLLDFYNKYENSGHRHVRLYLQYAQFRHEHALPMGLHYSFNTEQLENHASVAELEAELQEMQREAMQSSGAKERVTIKPNQYYLDFILDRVTRYSTELKRQYSVAKRPPGKSTVPAAGEIPKPDPELGQLEFTSLNLQVPLLHYDSTRWQPDGSGYDLVYDNEQVFRLDEHGDFLKINPEKGYTFIDDELIWLIEPGTSSEVRVYCRDRRANDVVVGESLNLPPFVDFKAIGVGKGIGIIIGWFEGGTWCGLIERDSEKVAFRVFHEAREYSPSNIKEDVQQASQSVNLRFQSRWLARGTDRRGPCLLVNRSGMTPLRIDLSKLHVEVIPLERADFHQGTVITNEKFYLSVYGSVFEWDLNSRSRSIPGTKIIGMDQLEQGRQGNATAGNQRGTLIVDGDWLIYPGATWYRYNLKTARTERLVKTSLPYPFSHGVVSQSSIHGIIHWHFRFDGSIPYVSQVSQVRIKDGASPIEVPGRLEKEGAFPIIIPGRFDAAISSFSSNLANAVALMLICLIFAALLFPRLLSVVHGRRSKQPTNQQRRPRMRLRGGSR
ncbi:hypothetical protein SH139x_004712 [Planctomycetaceae bacterium SH139]